MTEGWNFVLHEGCWSTPMLILIWRWVTVEQVTYTSAINQHFIELISSRLNSLILDACSVKKAVFKENIWFVITMKAMMCSSKQACFHFSIRSYDSWNLVCFLCCIQKLSKTAYTDMGWYLNVYSDNISRVCIHGPVYLKPKHVQFAITVNWSYEVQTWNNVFALSSLQVISLLSNTVRVQNLNQVVELSTITC